MGEVKNLDSDEAIAKVQELAKSINTCMFCTRLSHQPIATRPMALQQVDEEGVMWFLSSIESDKNMEIQKDNKVQLIFAAPSNSHFLSVYGEAKIYQEQDKIDEIWSGFAKAWFTEGKNDPTVTVIAVRPLDAYYWDTKNGKMVALIKIATAVVTGKTMDDGIEGKLVV